MRKRTEAAAGSRAYDCAMKHSMKMIWVCVALVVLAVVLGATGVKGAYLALFALPCMLMMGAMVWMMIRGMGGGSRGGQTK
jgi:uncharacterized membrane protein